MPAPAKHPAVDAFDVTVNRRNFLAVAAGASAFSFVSPALGNTKEISDDALEKAAARPIRKLTGVKEPVIIQSIELLRKGRDHFVRVRSKDGAEGVAVDDGRMDVLHPILNQLVIPFFIGKDARDLEELL